MAKIDWRIYSLATSEYITSKVLSMNIGFGRERYLDTYSGNLLTFTINNAGDYASSLTYGSVIRVSTFTNSVQDFYQIFWIQNIDFNDTPGDQGLNTATITCADWVSRSGRIQAQALSLDEEKVTTQWRKFNYSFSGTLPSDMVLSHSKAAQSTASAIVYTGTVASYINQAVVTERGYLVTYGNTLQLIARDDVATYTPITITLGRTSTASQIGYQQFDRIQNGLQFINTATIQSAGIADQTAVNSASVASVGPGYYSSTTVDFSTTQALGNASWIANNFSNLTSLYFKCSFSDRSQNKTALDSLISQLFFNSGTNRILNLAYQVPGGSLTTVKVVLEKYEFNVTPQQTDITFTMSPLTYYQFFTLDSTTLGILNTSRLGW